MVATLCVNFRLSIPTIFRPKVSAGKAIVNGLYQFEVKISLPVVGFLFGYSGTLKEDAEDTFG
ncbi:DUF4166 domain-containing protein [Microbulbifer sp. DLAB2-AF]|uniref:DUF4166 domain-containing protein n=1 Tax=Microbulbifer sp. DLAB2-AF TaxID=3243395 RepID=UPI004039E846